MSENFTIPEPGTIDSLSAKLEADRTNPDGEVALAAHIKPGPVIPYKAHKPTAYQELPFDPTKKLTTDTIVEGLEDKLAKVLHHMDDERFQEANLSTLVKAAGLLIDRRALLRGEPTQIVSSEERAALPKLLPILLLEAKRRGFDARVIEGKVISP